MLNHDERSPLTRSSLSIIPGSLFSLLVVFSMLGPHGSAMAQSPEICNNGIDDDGDTLVLSLTGDDGVESRATWQRHR